MEPGVTHIRLWGRANQTISFPSISLNYESLLFNVELDRVKFSLSDQYQHKYNSFDNI